MVLSDENNPTLIRPTKLQGSEMVSRKFGAEISHKRRALSSIHQNFVVSKRDLSEAQEIRDKFPPRPVHRPITRKFSAQIASTHPEENKKPNSSFQDFTVWEDCPINEVEEHKEITDQAVPMSLEQTEAIPDEKAEMEVEMEDTEELIMDIDGCDVKNPLAVVDYVDELYAYYRKMEIFSQANSGEKEAAVGWVGCHASSMQI